MSRARDTAGIIQYNRISFDSNNAVGIGSSIPDTKLDVAGGMRVTGIVTASSFVGAITGTASDASGASGDFSIADKIVHTGDTNTAIRFPAADTFTVETAGSERLRVSSNVGVGDDNPSVKLNVKGSGDSLAGLNVHSKIEDTTSLAANVGGMLAFEGVYTSGAAEAVFSAIHGGKENGTDGNYAGYLRVFTRANGGLPAERLRIDSGGRLLLGTGGLSTDQDAAFQVASTSFGVAQIFRTGSAGSSLHLSSTTGTLASPAALADGDHAGYLSYRAYDGAAWRTGANIGAAADGQTWASGDCPTRLVFATTADAGTSPTERLRITSTGIVRIPDSGKFTCGASDDLQIYHNGSNSFIEDKGTGILALTTNGTGIHFMNDAQDEFLAKFQKDGEVILYQDNSARVTTTADGVDFGGTGSIKVPVGTTAQRNASPTAGDFRYNSETGGFEGYTTEWGSIAGGGGGITSAFSSPSGITTHVFLSDAQEHKFTCSGITTISCAGGVEGESHTIRIINSGITTVGFSTFFLFPSGAAPSLPTADGAISLISFTVNRVGAAGTQLLAGASVNFS